MRPIIPLGDLGRGDAAEVGVKAATLGALVAAGLPVPPGFAVTAEAAARLDAGDRAAIEAALDGLGPVAVRSSSPGEDLDSESRAGRYLSLLDVRGRDAVLDAVRRVVASAGGEPMPVLVQAMVDARAAGVVFSADPVSGARDTAVVSAVRGLGDRLAGEGVAADEWEVRGDRAEPRRVVEGAIDAAAATSIAGLARRCAILLGAPQDVEWALDADGLRLVQSRPITALPDEVTWEAPPGAWARDFRLGEWLTGPTTPLFASWLLPLLEDGFAAAYTEAFGFRARPPHHALLHGWYFASLNFFPSTPADLARTMLLEYLPRLVRRPRFAAVAIPPLAGLGVELHVRDWRERILPAYRAAVAAAEAQVDQASSDELIAMVDRLGAQAGRYFASITFVAGYAWKAELPLAEWLRARGEPHLPLLGGLGAAPAPPWAASSLDWSQPTLGELDATASPPPPSGAARLRAAEEERLRSRFRGSDLRRFDRLLSRAQRFARLREEQVREFTLAWPVLRRAVLRLGNVLVASSVTARPEDIHFLRRDELDASVRLDGAVTARRLSWTRQRRLAPPLHLGPRPAILRSLDARADAMRRRVEGPVLVEGLPASPGVASGAVRVVRGPDEFARFTAGEVLVAPTTTPAWSPLLARAAAVITDGGSVLAHASILARELGIPAIVATVDATRRLRPGQLVTVDGATGAVTPAGRAPTDS